MLPLSLRSGLFLRVSNAVTHREPDVSAIRRNRLFGIKALRTCDVMGYVVLLRDIVLPNRGAGQMENCKSFLVFR